MPADMAPSPMTAMTLLLPPLRSRATAMPRPAEIEVEECAAPNGSYSLSRALGEAGKPAFLAQRADAVAAAGQDLVRIGLVADIPDQPVVRRVEDVVQRDRQLDDAEAGAEMAAGDARRRRSVRRAVRRQAAAGRASGSVRRSAGTRTCVEKRRFGGCVHGLEACLLGWIACRR